MLIRLLEFFSSPLGTNYYSFGIQLTLFITVLSYAYLGFSDRKFFSLNIFFYLAIIYLLQTIHGLISTSIGTPLPAPVLDRGIVLLQLLFVLLTLRKVTLTKITLLLIVLFLAILWLIALMLSGLPMTEGGVGNYNYTQPAFYWSLALFLFSLASLIISISQKDVLRPVNQVFFALVAIGSLADMVFIPFAGDFSGFIRLALFVAFPLLMIVPNLLFSSEKQIDEEVMGGFVSRIEKTTDEFFAEAPQQPQTGNEMEDANGSWSVEYSTLLNEVKQPLSSILGYADLLQKEENGELSALQRKYIDRIRSAAGSIEHRVDEINHLREIDQGGMKFIPEVIDLEDIVNNSIRRSEFLIKEKEIKTEHSLALGDKKLIGDKNSLQTILNIAVENAVTATRSGTVVTISALEDTANRGHIMLSITDCGEGIEPDEIGHIFDKRISTSDPLIKGIGDKGVGLSVLLALVEAQHGSISVSTNPAQGTTFSISLPMNIIGTFQPIAEVEKSENEPS